MMLDLGEADRPRTEVIATTRRPLWSQDNLSDWWACYAEKLEGANESAEETEGTIHACFSFLGCFISISLLGLLQEFLVPGLSNVYQVPLVLLTPSWGVTAIQVFCAWPVPGAQPKNVILGNLIGAVSALVVQVTPFPDLIPKILQAAVAVSSTLLVQEMAGAVHPAGAATAFLLANAEEVTWHSLGLTVFGSVLIVAVAVLLNNLSIDRFYPQYWWPAVRPPDGPPGQRLQPPVSFLMEAPEQWLKVYVEKIQGGDALGPLQVSIAHSCFSALASLVFMLSLIVINEAFGFDPSRLAAAAAASSLLFSDWQGAHSQPLPCLIGSLIAGLCGSLCQVLPQLGMEIPMWTQAALGVGLTAFCMEMVNSAFPAGGAIALGFVVNPPRSPWVSVLYTGLLSSALLIIYGVFVNNLQETRRYPRRWPWQKGTSPRYPPPASLPAHRYSERNLIRRWTDETNSGTSGTKYSKIYVGVLTVGLQFFFLTFLFFADFDLTDSVASMCNGWACVSFALVGLVYTRSFLKAYGLGSVGYCLLVLCVSVQWSMIVESLVNGTVLHVSFANLMNGCSSAAVVLVSFGALVGKVDPLQILTLVLIELPCYCWNKVVFLQMGSEKTPLVQDRGTLLIFLFGSFFGLAAGKTLGVPEMDWLNRSQRNTELLSLFGTCCLWCSLPSFPGHSETSSSTMAWQHTVMALLGSTVATFTLDPFLHDGRLEPAAVRSAVLAGGVAIGGVADIVGPCTALAVGCIAGSASTICLGFSDKNVDTSGVFYAYGLPALIGGITSMGRINHESVGNQAFGLCGTLTIACLSGAVCGRLLRSLRASVDLAFSDEVHWDCAEDLPRGVLSL